MTQPEKLKIKYSDYDDIVEIEGVAYSGHLFRELGGGICPTPKDIFLKILKKEDGVITIQQQQFGCEKETINNLIPDQIIDRFLEILNRACKSDKEAIFRLINNRVQCSKELADDPTIQVGSVGKDFKVGMLGVINGLCGIDHKSGYGPISAIFDIYGKLTGFKRSPGTINNG